MYLLVLYSRICKQNKEKEPFASVIKGCCARFLRQREKNGRQKHVEENKRKDVTFFKVFCSESSRTQRGGVNVPKKKKIASCHHLLGWGRLEAINTSSLVHFLMFVNDKLIVHSYNLIYMHYRQMLHLLVTFVDLFVCFQKQRFGINVFTLSCQQQLRHVLLFCLWVLCRLYWNPRHSPLFLPLP